MGLFPSIPWRTVSHNQRWSSRIITPCPWNNPPSAHPCRHVACWPIHKAIEAPRWPRGCMPLECCAPSPGNVATWQRHIGRGMYAAVCCWPGVVIPFPKRNWCLSENHESLNSLNNLNQPKKYLKMGCSSLPWEFGTLAHAAVHRCAGIFARADLLRNNVKLGQVLQSAMG